MIATYPTDTIILFIEAERDLKNSFKAWCDSHGVTMIVALNVLMMAVARGDVVDEELLEEMQQVVEDRRRDKIIKRLNTLTRNRNKQ